MKNKKVVIVGGGTGGLATASLLGRHGYDVTLIEKNKTLGGRARSFSQKGYTFDMGPSWYLMPDVFEKFYKLFDKKPSDFFTLKQLDPQYRIFFDRQDIVDISKDLAKNLSYFESLEKGAKENIKKYLDQSEYQYKTAMSDFVYKSFNTVLDMFSLKLLKEGSKLNVFEDMGSFIRRFTKNDRIAKILLYTIVFLGGSPKNTPAIYSIMSYIDFMQGVFYPKGGMFEIVKSLITLAKENHVKILTNTAVTKIDVDKNGNATGVRVGKKVIEADIVISNADLPFTEMSLLDEGYRSYPKKYWDKKTIAPSAFLIYLGIKGRVKNIKHHNLLFASDWTKHFDEIFTNPSWPNDPSMYICAPSKTDQSVAPKDHENIFILVPVASGLVDSEKMRQKYANFVIKQVEKIVDEEIEKRIEYKRIFSQKNFADDYNAYKGTALGMTHTMFQSAAFRPSVKSKKVKNLYYVGQYTQPGIGVPMCLISAQIVLERIIKDVN